MIVNHIPTSISGFQTTEITLSSVDGIKGIKSIMIVHNIPTIGHVNSISAAVENWMGRSEKYDDKSLVDYINSKRVFKAYTIKAFNKEFNLSA